MRLKKILFVNAVPYGSTATVMNNLAHISVRAGYTVTTSSGYSYHPLRDFQNYPGNIKHICVGNIFSKTAHMMMSKITGLHGVYSYWSTKRFLKKVEKFSPNIIHLHNIHGWYLNFPMLFEHLKRTKISVVWTFHDCWPFTGGCAHFTYCDCEKWKASCGGCTNLGCYPIESKIDRTKEMLALKARCFLGVENLTIVTPSHWLAGLVKESFLKEYPVKVIHNGIDLSVFRPTESDFRKRYGLEGKKLVLGVAFGWGVRKGLDVFVSLAGRLPDTYKIILVGTDPHLDTQLPEAILSIHRTQNQTELAEIYTAADVFVNPTREENYPTVNMEALACGTPVLTFRTGGSPEILDSTCGAVVDCGDIDALTKEILRICEESPYTAEACTKKAREFDQNERFKEYIALYEGVDPPRGEGH